jgi:FtsX-like permease family protein
VISSSLSQTAFTMALLAIAALVALALGVVGLYGVISYVVGQRQNETGVRLALGARPAQIRRMVLRQGAFLALAGIAVGLGAALGLTRLMQSLLFEVSARDPWIFAESAVALVLVSLLACDLPARRAAGCSRSSASGDWTAARAHFASCSKQDEWCKWFGVMAALKAGDKVAAKNERDALLKLYRRSQVHMIVRSQLMTPTS